MVPNFDDLYQMRREGFLREIKQAQEIEFIKEMKVVAGDDVNTCEYCQAQDGRKYPKDVVPELPHLAETGCSCSVGCRCIVVAVVPDEF